MVWLLPPALSSLMMISPRRGGWGWGLRSLIMFKRDDRMLNFYLSELEMKEVTEKHNKLAVVTVIATGYCSSSSQPREGRVLPFSLPSCCGISYLLSSLCKVFKVSPVCPKHNFRLSEWLHLGWEFKIKDYTNRSAQSNTTLSLCGFEKNQGSAQACVLCNQPLHWHTNLLALYEAKRLIKTQMLTPVVR